MALIIWNNMYSVNVESLDTQHKKLVELVNQLHDSIKSGQKDKVLTGIYNELIGYTITHFRDEEALMRKAGYADLEDHIDIHRSLVERVKKLQKDYFDGNPNAWNETLEFLRNWLLKHIAGTDKKYSQALNQAGIV
ncbi:MAG TPA: bacteriohemerythrin [Bacteroidales bacterium]|nr:bacteriohemerythrin [Bacteroidales bacterium]